MLSYTKSLVVVCLDQTVLNWEEPGLEGPICIRIFSFDMILGFYACLILKKKFNRLMVQQGMFFVEIDVNHSLMNNFLIVRNNPKFLASILQF